MDASAGTVQVPVLLGGPLGANPGVPVTVPYTTADGSAEAGTDYTAVSGTLTFPPGATLQTVRIPILDCDTSGPVNFTFTLSSETGGTTSGSGTATIMVVNPAAAPGAPTGVTATAGSSDSATVSRSPPTR